MGALRALIVSTFALVVACCESTPVSTYCNPITQALSDQGTSGVDIVNLVESSVNRALVYPFFVDVTPPSSPGITLAVSFVDACQTRASATNCAAAAPSSVTTRQTVWMQSATFVVATVLKSTRAVAIPSPTAFLNQSLAAVASAQSTLYPSIASTSLLEDPLLPLSAIGAASADASLLGSPGSDRIQWCAQSEVAAQSARQLLGNHLPYSHRYLSAFRGIRSSLAAGNVTVVAFQGRCDVGGSAGALAVPGTAAYTSIIPSSRLLACPIAAVVAGIDDQNIYLQTVVGQAGTKASIAVAGFVPLQEFLDRWTVAVPIVPVGTSASTSVCNNCLLSLQSSSVADALSPLRRAISKPLSELLRL